MTDSTFASSHHSTSQHSSSELVLGSCWPHSPYISIFPQSLSDIVLYLPQPPSLRWERFYSSERSSIDTDGKSSYYLVFSQQPNFFCFYIFKKTPMCFFSQLPPWGLR